MADLVCLTYNNTKTIINLDKVAEIEITGDVVTIYYTNNQTSEFVDKNHNIQKYFMEKLKREAENEKDTI